MISHFGYKIDFDLIYFWALEKRSLYYRLLKDFRSKNALACIVQASACFSNTYPHQHSF